MYGLAYTKQCDITLVTEFKTNATIISINGNDDRHCFGQGSSAGDRAVYPQLISRQLFEECKRIREGRGRGKAVKVTKNEFMFRGLLTCAVSGRKVTSDLKKGRYVYLLCRDPENPEKKLHIPESKVLAQIEQVYRAIDLPERLVEALTEHLKTSHEAEILFHEKAIAELQQRNHQLQKRMDTLLDMRLDQRITQDMYDEKMHQMKEEQLIIHDQIKTHHVADESYRVSLV